MNYLQLCQLVARRAGIAGASAGMPADVTGQPERLQLACDFVADAVADIETAYLDWSFMRSSIDFFIEGGTEWLDPSETHGDLLSINEAAVYGRNERLEQQIWPMPWPELRRRRETTMSLIEVESIPTHFAVDQSGIIQFYPVAKNAYTLRAEYVLAPSVMAAATDKPRIPDTHSRAIVWRALALYHERDEADLLMQRAEGRFAEWMSRMEAAFLPDNAWTRTHSPEVPMVMRTE